MDDKQTLVKCLVWDLDETLWRGTLVEDGNVRLADGITAVVKELDSRGVLQAVASKNDHDLAWARLVELGVADYFVLPQIGWGRKSDSVRRIAERLNFAPGTIAFIDDQPAERAEVAFHLPEVRCYPADQALALPGLPEFSPRAVTVDSRRRRQLYQANFQRESERVSFAGPDEEFLRTLGLELRVGRADDEELSRVEELTLRTSQMNATGVHYPDAVLRELCADPAHEVLVATLTDRFGPHGAIGVLLLETRPDRWHLKLLATSCRVVSFGVGTVVLNWLVDQAFRAGVHLVADFRATDRNRMMDIAYRFAGFTDERCECSTERPAEAGVQRLHLVPEPRSLPDTMRLDAPALGRPRVP
ncbi:HAD-IIIC family phosphatase [Saccharopolyspora sp. NPDC050642]|uniref:HAD-IIIC family phosphatase n=1 Tax=Saccharopolyspora sp. NPDC050642 TaxID=3157099 RepID=UPI00340A72FB